MLENTITLTPIRLVDYIVDAALAESTDITSGKRDFVGQPGLVLGPAGVGKSSAFYQAAEKLTEMTGKVWEVIDVRVMLYDPTELKGMPTLGSVDDYVKLLKPDWSRNLNPDKCYLIVFEEGTKALPAVQAALMQVVLDRLIAEFQFGKHWVPFMTGNLLSSRSGDIPTPAALRNRFWIVIVRADVPAWLSWAEAHDICPIIRSFITARPEYIDTWNADDDPLVFASPRSLESLSRMVQRHTEVDDRVAALKRWAKPYLGNEAGAELTVHAQLCMHVPDPRAVLADPHGADICEDIGAGLYLARSLAAWTDANTFSNMVAYARRCPGEVASTMVHTVIKRLPELKETEAYTRFACDYDPRQSA